VVKRRTILRNLASSLIVVTGLGYLNKKTAHSIEIKPEIVTVDGWVLLSTDR
jgi:uncharacterized membrane-anchored protein